MVLLLELVVEAETSPGIKKLHLISTLHFIQRNPRKNNCIKILVFRSSCPAGISFNVHLQTSDCLEVPFWWRLTMTTICRTQEVRSRGGSWSPNLKVGGSSLGPKPLPKTHTNKDYVIIILCSNNSHSVITFKKIPWKDFMFGPATFRVL